MRAGLDHSHQCHCSRGSRDVTPPVRPRFVGAALFDGEHRGGASHRDKTDGAHGREQQFSAGIVGDAPGILSLEGIVSIVVCRHSFRFSVDEFH